MLLNRDHAVRTLALLTCTAALSGCASGIPDRMPPPLTIRAVGDAPPARLMLQQTEHIELAFTPEGNRESIKSRDYRYYLESQDGQTVALPFLDAKRADSDAKIDHLAYSATNACWVASTVSPGIHEVHIEGVFGWKSVDDQYAPATIRVFKADKLINSRKLEVCNPGPQKNPKIQYDPEQLALRFCGKQGTMRYVPITRTLTVEDPTACCPAPPERFYYGNNRKHEQFFELSKDTR
ncbi:hypothetical protein [Chitinimonas sp.]|uniref:hypothetical protein n=1 Tax=Chitinimonas sp. TaxID=1934313 RepID=UPI002F9538B3